MLNRGTKILLTGSGGMLGEAVYNHFKDKCKVYATDIDLNEPWLSYLDVRNYNQILSTALKIKPDYIFHLAALTDMEFCEKNPIEAYKTNTIGTENVALVCKKLNIPMISISTAGVFDGQKDIYDDFDSPNPLSIYGKSKNAGDQAIIRILSKYYIFRPGWMIGGGPPKDKKFINKMIKQIKEGKKQLNVVDDKFGSPTYTYDLAKIIEATITTCPPGLYNSVCEGSGSRYDIALSILRNKNLDKKIKVSKVKSSFFKNDYFAPRPASEKLNNYKLKIRGVNIPRSWDICLKEYLDKFDWEI
jgi:dTDP-4-dehydrorhamnose reductase